MLASTSDRKNMKEAIMRMLVIVVVEETQEGWSAWFRDSSHNVCVAHCDILAVLELIETHGTADMDAWDMVKLDARSREGHYEYLLPCACRRQVANKPISITPETSLTEPGFQTENQ